MSLTRRKLILSGSVGSVVVVAGCIDNGEDDTT